MTGDLEIAMMGVGEVIAMVTETMIGIEAMVVAMEKETDVEIMVLVVEETTIGVVMVIEKEEDLTMLIHGEVVTVMFEIHIKILKEWRENLVRFQVTYRPYA